MSDRTQTGIALLDDNVDALQARRTYLVYGAPGTGKTLLGLQFLAAGLRRGEPGVLVTQERPADVLSSSSSFGLGLEAAVLDGSLHVLEFDADFTGRLLRHGWKPCLEQLQALTGGAGARRAVLDPVQPMFAATTDESRLRGDMRLVVDTLETWGWTTLLLQGSAELERHPSLGPVATEICWGTFELQVDIDGLESCSYLYVHKLRGSSRPRRRIPFRIEAGSGLVELEPAAPGGREVAPPLAVAAPPTAPPTVLVADDDPFILRLLARSLTPGFRVLGAADGLEALTLTVREKPDVVVLDVSLPKMSGFDICRSLRECGFDMPILFISGMAVDSNDRLRGILVGGNDYIVKPFHAREVTEKIRAASRYRVRLGERPRRGHDLDHLIQAALQRTVSRPTFLEMCAKACENAARYTAPLGLVRLAWEATADGDDDAVKRWLLDAVHAVTRPEDTAAVTEPHEIMVILNAEDRRGTLAYVRDLCERLAVQPHPETGAQPRLFVSHAVYDPRAMPAWDLETALARVREEPEALPHAPGPSPLAGTPPRRQAEA